MNTDTTDTATQDVDIEEVPWIIAQRFMDADHNIISMPDFGPVGSALRVKAGPKLAYFCGRASQHQRIQVGLTEIRADGKVYGAVIRKRTGVYEWIADYLWPESGELWDLKGFPGKGPARWKRTIAKEPRLNVSEASDQAPATLPAPVPVPVVTEPTPEPTPEPEADVMKVVHRGAENIILSGGGKIIVAKIINEVEA